MNRLSCNCPARDVDNLQSRILRNVMFTTMSSGNMIVLLSLFENDVVFQRFLDDCSLLVHEAKNQGGNNVLEGTRMAIMTNDIN